LAPKSLDVISKSKFFCPEQYKTMRSKN